MSVIAYVNTNHIVSYDMTITPFLVVTIDNFNETACHNITVRDRSSVVLAFHKTTGTGSFHYHTHNAFLMKKWGGGRH